MSKLFAILMFSCVLLAFALFVTANLAAETLADHVEPFSQGYGGPKFHLGTLFNKTMFLGGGALLVAINENFLLGSEVLYGEGDVDGNFLGYGGLKSEWRFMRWGAFNVTGGLLGGYGFLKNEIAGTNMDLVVLEPELLLDMSLIPGTAFSLGASYRLAVPIAGEQLANWWELSGFNFVFQLKDGPLPDEKPLLSQVPFALGGFYHFGVAIMQQNAVFYDGGGTKFYFLDHFALGASGRIAASSFDLNGKSFSAMEMGLWIEYFINPEDIIVFSCGGLTGLGFYGFYETATGNLDGAPSYFMNPSVFVTFKLTPYAQLTFGAGYDWVPNRLTLSYFDNNVSSFNFCIQLRNGGLH